MIKLCVLASQSLDKDYLSSGNLRLTGAQEKQNKTVIIIECPFPILFGESMLQQNSAIL